MTERSVREQVEEIVQYAKSCQSNSGYLAAGSMLIERADLFAASEETAAENERLRKAIGAAQALLRTEILSRRNASRNVSDAADVLYAALQENQG